MFLVPMLTSRMEELRENIDTLLRLGYPFLHKNEAFLAATFLINRTPSKVIGYSTPLEHLFNVKPNFSALCIFGCSCWLHLHPFNSKKLEFCSKECVFMGYNNMHKGFKCLDMSSGRIYISRDVVFDEHVFPFSKLPGNAGPRLQSEILLLPPSLINSPGGDLASNHMTHVPTNVC
jgi:hypothetical protein